MMPGTRSPPPIVETMSSINTLRYFTSGPPAKGGNTRSSSKSATNTVTLPSELDVSGCDELTAGAAVGAAAAGAASELSSASEPPQATANASRSISDIEIKAKRLIVCFVV